MRGNENGAAFAPLERTLNSIGGWEAQAGRPWFVNEPRKTFSMGEESETTFLESALEQSLRTRKESPPASAKRTEARQVFLEGR